MRVRKRRAVEALTMSSDRRKEPAEITHPTEFDELFGRAYPNPERVGCPSRADLNYSRTAPATDRGSGLRPLKECLALLLGGSRHPEGRRPPPHSHVGSRSRARHRCRYRRLDALERKGSRRHRDSCAAGSATVRNHARGIAVGRPSSLAASAWAGVAVVGLAHRLRARSIRCGG